MKLQHIPSGTGSKARNHHVLNLSVKSEQITETPKAAVAIQLWNMKSLSASLVLANHLLTGPTIYLTTFHPSTLGHLPPSSIHQIVNKEILNRFIPNLTITHLLTPHSPITEPFLGSAHHLLTGIVISAVDM